MTAENTETNKPCPNASDAFNTLFLNAESLSITSTLLPNPSFQLQSRSIDAMIDLAKAIPDQYPSLTDMLEDMATPVKAMAAAKGMTVPAQIFSIEDPATKATLQRLDDVIFGRGKYPFGALDTIAFEQIVMLQAPLMLKQLEKKIAAYKPA